MRKCEAVNNKIAYFSAPAENKFDLELSSKVFFFTESCSVDIAFKDSE